MAVTRRLMLGILVGTPLSELIPKALGSPTLHYRSGSKIVHGFSVGIHCEGWARVAMAVEQEGRWVKLTESLIEPNTNAYHHRFATPIYADRWVVSVSQVTAPVTLLGGHVDIQDGRYIGSQKLPIAPKSATVIFNRRALPSGGNAALAHLTSVRP